MARECGCGGGNENCTACYGSGYLEDGSDRPLRNEQMSEDFADPASQQKPAMLTTAESDPRGRRNFQAPEAKAAEDPYIPALGCPYCPARFNSDERMEAHISAEHVASGTDAGDEAGSKPLVRVGGRNFDRRALRRAEQRQLKRLSGPQQLAAQGKSRSGYASRPGTKTPAVAPMKQSQLVPASGTRPCLVHCPKCPSPVRADRLQKHLRDKHNRGNTTAIIAAPTKPTSAAIRSSPQPPSHKLTRKVRKRATVSAVSLHPSAAKGDGNNGPAEDDAVVGELDNYREERRLDGSRDYSQFREEGKFGSHPSYDDCDDESAP